jgi:hypothetical protein
MSRPPQHLFPARIPSGRIVALTLAGALAGCSSSERAASPSAIATAPTAVAVSSDTPVTRPAAVDRSAPGGGGSNVAADVSFPPRNEPFDFRLRLEAQYQNVLRRPQQQSFVDIEGTIVWTQEYLRYRVNGCGQADAIARVAAQIVGQGVQPVCSNFTGTTVTFPPRDQPFAFRQELERIYRDVLGRPASLSAVDTEGDIVWTQEYLRYRVNSCSHLEAVDRVLSQTLGGPVQPTCAGGVVDPPATGGGGPVTGFVTAVSSGGAQGVQQTTPRPNAGAGPVISVTNAGGFNAGGTTTVTLNSSAPVSSVFVSANSTVGSSSLRPAAVTDTFFLISLPSPQTTIPLSVQLAQNVSGRFALEFGGAGPGGPPGNFAQLPVQIDTTPQCTFALLNGTASFGASGGQGSVNVSVQAGCGWTLSSNQGFVSISRPSGSGSITVPFTVAANTGGARTARLTLVGTNGGGATFDISQAANPCTYSVSTNTTNFIAAGGTLNVTVTTGAGCSWSASSLAQFITAGGNTSGTGTGTASFNVGANTNTTARSGTIRVSFTSTGGSQDVGINQSGAAIPPPAAVLTAPARCDVNAACAFSGTGSTGQITSYAWDFGDGTSGSGATINHTYSTSFSTACSRSVTVRLTVTGPGGTSAATTSLMLIHQPNCVG